jgi:hypothetical protein
MSCKPAEPLVLDLSFQHLHHLEDETAGRPEEGETSSTKSRRYLGWLNEDLGADRANACVLGVEVVHFVDRMGEAGPNANGNKILVSKRSMPYRERATKHGHARHGGGRRSRVYAAWRSMIHRCENGGPLAAISSGPDRLLPSEIAAFLALVAIR